MQTQAVINESVKEKQGYRVFGRHVYGDVIVKNREMLKNMEFLRRIVTEAAMIGGMTLLDVKSWRIGEGVSVMALVLESHITVHTWPEHMYATIDVYSCGEHTSPEKAFDYITKKLDAIEVRKGIVDRSLV